MAAWCTRGEVLLALTRAGISREDAYAIVQRNAMATWSKLGTSEARSFRDNLLADLEVSRRVSAAELTSALEAGMHLHAVDAIFQRVFREDARDDVA